MTEIELTVTGAFAKAKVTGKITAGMVGCKVCVKLDTAWDGLTPTLVAKSGGEATAMVIGADGWSEVPHERCIGGARLLLGIDGKTADGKKRIPTVWADCGIVAASPADEELTQSVEPTPELVDQIAAQAHQAALDAAIAQEVARQAEAGEFDGFSPTAKVEDGDDVVTVTITDKDGAHSFTVPKDASPELVAQTVAAYFAEHPIVYPVRSVNGKNGDVQLTAEDMPYGDGNVAAALANIPTALSQLTEDATHRVVTDAEKQTWNGKQNALAFDAAPTAGSGNPVTSGGVASALAAYKYNAGDVIEMTAGAFDRVIGFGHITGSSTWLFCFIPFSDVNPNCDFLISGKFQVRNDNNYSWNGDLSDSRCVGKEISNQGFHFHIEGVTGGTNNSAVSLAVPTYGTLRIELI